LKPKKAATTKHSQKITFILSTEYVWNSEYVTNYLQSIKKYNKDMVPQS